MSAQLCEFCRFLAIPADTLRACLCVMTGSASSSVAMTLFHSEVHTLATTAGKIIVYTLATTLISPQSSGNSKYAQTSSGKAPLGGQDPVGEDVPDVDEVLSQLEQLVDLLEQYFHPSNNGRYTYVMLHIAQSDSWCLLNA